MSAPELTLYTAQTPNGIKISILLEELGLPYKVEKIDFSKNTQKEPWFLKVNPNGRIPAFTDHKSPIDGKEIHIWESGSIMLYLVQHYDKEYKFSWKPDTREYADMINWLFFQNAGLGPMQGQANNFYRYAPEKIQYGIDRYQNETRRLYGVLEKRIQDQESNGGYLVGNHVSIADFACWGWVSSAAWAGVEIDEFPVLKAWQKKLESRPALVKGRDVPEPSKLLAMRGDKEKMDAYAKEASAWVMKGMKDDAKK